MLKGALMSKQGGLLMLKIGTEEGMCVCVFVCELDPQPEQQESAQAQLRGRGRCCLYQCVPGAFDTPVV